MFKEKIETRCWRLKHVQVIYLQFVFAIFPLNKLINWLNLSQLSTSLHLTFATTKPPFPTSTKWKLTSCGQSGRCCNIAHVHFCQTKSSTITKHDLWKEAQNAQPLLTNIDSFQNMHCNDCEGKKRANWKWTYLHHWMKMNGEDGIF
jgi:hypothetical protein